MCEFISWVEKRGKVKFLTGKQLFSEQGQAFLKERGISPDDYSGHGTIRVWYGIDEGDGIDKEQTDFSSPKNFPPEIAEAIKKGEMAGFPIPYGLLRAPLDADYNAKLALLDADYNAKLALLNADYWAKRDPLDADDNAKLAPLDADYKAKLALLNADYNAKRAPLDAEYWAKFSVAENRMEVWR